MNRMLFKVIVLSLLIIPISLASNLTSDSYKAKITINPSGSCTWISCSSNSVPAVSVNFWVECTTAQPMLRGYNITENTIGIMSSCKGKCCEIG